MAIFDQHVLGEDRLVLVRKGKKKKKKCTYEVIWDTAWRWKTSFYTWRALQVL